MTVSFLASVTSADEAMLAVAGGADIIDCKDPGRGALGALPVATVAAIRAVVPAGIPVSATIGDLHAEPGLVAAAAQGMAASGCDIVKIGFFPGGDPRATIAALGDLDLGSTRLAGLLLADLKPDFSLIGAMGEARFAGVMLDTAGKDGRSLLDHATLPVLSHFIAQAHNAGLFAGLAGSLQLCHVAGLLRLKPNVLGFRGALCDGSVRTGTLSASAITAIRAGIDRGMGQACGLQSGTAG